MKVAMKIPEKISERKEEYNRSYGANNHTSLLSHAQSQSLELDVSRLKELVPAFFDRALYL